MTPSLTIGTYNEDAGGYVLSVDRTVLAVGGVSSEGESPALAAFHAGAATASEQDVTSVQVYGIQRGRAMPPEDVIVQFTGDDNEFTPLANAFARARASDILLERDLTTDTSAPVLNPVHIYTDAAYDHDSETGQIGYVIFDGVGVVRSLVGRTVASGSIRELEYTAALEAAKEATALDRADELRFVTDNWQTRDALDLSTPIDSDTTTTGVELHHFMQDLRGFSVTVEHEDRSSVRIADTLASLAKGGDISFTSRR